MVCENLQWHQPLMNGTVLKMCVVGKLVRENLHCHQTFYINGSILESSPGMRKRKTENGVPTSTEFHHLSTKTIKTTRCNTIPSQDGLRHVTVSSVGPSHSLHPCIHWRVRVTVPWPHVAEHGPTLLHMDHSIQRVTIKTLLHIVLVEHNGKSIIHFIPIF